MFHTLLYIIACIATVACGQRTFDRRRLQQNNAAVSRAACSALMTTAGNVFCNVVLMQVFEFLLRGPAPPLAYTFPTLLSTVVMFEVFWFVGCTACERQTVLVNAERNHTSYNRWTISKGNFENAASLLDMHPWQSMCSTVLPFFATALVCQGGYWINLLLICHMCVRQFTFYERLKLTFA